MEIGDKYHFFTVENKYFRHTCPHVLLKCVCGNTMENRESWFKHHPIRSCGCMVKNRDASSGNKCKTFKGIGEISKQYYQNLERSAIIRGYEFNIALDFMWDLFIKQNKQCVFTGEELTFATLRQVKRGLIQSASIDRINNDIGYVESNIQWVHKDVNLIRGKMTVSQFIDMISSIYNYIILSKIPDETIREPVIIGSFNPDSVTYLMEIRQYEYKKRLHAEYQCVCGKIINRHLFGFKKEPKFWQSCGCKTDFIKSMKIITAKWQGIGEIGKSVIGSIERHARVGGRECSITLQFLWDLFVKQNKRCAYTGQRLYFNDGLVGQTASLDRINSEIGYTEENVQWIHRDVNWAKKDLTTERFMELILKIHDRWQAGLIPCFSTLKMSRHSL